MSKVTKKEIIDAVADMYEMSKKSVKDILDATLDTIAENLEEGNAVDLFGFGKFSITERAARKGRNPATGETIDIAASKSVKFKPSKTLKDTVNQ